MSKKVNILFSDFEYFPPKGGGTISVRALFKYLQDDKIETGVRFNCEAIYCGIQRDPEVTSYPVRLPHLRGYWINIFFLNRLWIKILLEHLRNKKYDILLTQNHFIPATVKVGELLKIPVVVFIRGFDFMNFFHFYKRRFIDPRFFMQFPFYLAARRWFVAALERASVIIANSEFTQKRIEKILGKSVEVIYPFIDFEECTSQQSKNREFITMFFPHIHKGGEIVLKIAERLQEKKFLVIGNGDAKIITKLKRLPNVTYLPFTDNVKEAYARTRILLVPSIIEESFGRVIIEARLNNIPVIGSNKGNIPNAIGKAGSIIYDFGNIDAWVEEIKRYDDDEYLKSKVRFAQLSLQKYRLEIQAKKFKEVIFNLLKK